jgi:hypothetical protein
VNDKIPEWAENSPILLAAKVRQLERENAALRATLEQCEEALEYAFIFGAFSDEARRKVRVALDAVRKEAQP